MALFIMLFAFVVVDRFMFHRIYPYIILCGLSFWVSGFCVGQIDTEFGEAGRFVYANGEYNTLVDLVKTDDDGVLLAIQSIESSGDYNTDYILVKLTFDGALDDEFGIGGIVKGDFDGYSNSEPKNLQVFADGGFVLTGLANDGGELNDVVVVHFLPTGLVDMTYGMNGVNVYQPSTLSNLEYRFFQSDLTPGVLVGSAMFIRDVEYNSFSAITRLADNWAIDTTFQETGTLLMDFVKGFSAGENSKVAHTEGGSVLSCVPLQDGAFILAGYYFLEAGLRVGYICKIDSDGQLDSSFATNGFLNIHSPGSSESRVIDLKPNTDTSGFYAAVREITNPDNDFVVYQIAENGIIEDTVIFDVKGASDNMQCLNVTEDFVVTAGYTIKPANESASFRDSDFWALAWFDQDDAFEKKFWFEDDLNNSQKGIQRIISVDGNQVIVGGFQEGVNNGVRDIVVSKLDLDEATGTSEIVGEFDWGFYPTIVEKEGFVYVHPDVRSVRVFDLKGQLLKACRLEDTRADLDLSQSGLLIIELSNGQKTQRKKVLVTGD